MTRAGALQEEDGKTLLKGGEESDPNQPPQAELSRTSAPL